MLLFQEMFNYGLVSSPLIEAAARLTLSLTGEEVETQDRK